jgi:nicotinamide phosphoribosyltransferase
MWLGSLLHTDVYKVGHEAQYPEDITKIYSTLVARSGKTYPASVQFGDSFYLKEYLMNGIKRGDVQQFMLLADAILGPGKVKPADFYKLQELGYWPVEIKSLPEGSLVRTGNVLTSYESTNKDLPWVGGFLEGLTLKVWNSSTVATNSFRLRKVVELFAERTAETMDHVDYQIHDFGYRGCSSEETAAIGGAAHLLSFRGTDTIPGVALLDTFYNVDNSTPLSAIGNSVPASEHSVACAWSGTQAKYVDSVEEIFDEVTGRWLVSHYLKDGKVVSNV